MLNDYIHKKEQLGTVMKNIDEVIKLKRWVSLLSRVNKFIKEINKPVGDSFCIEAERINHRRRANAQNICLRKLFTVDN